MVHNTAWVPGHFHLIFAGTVVTMYLAVAYHLWPKLCSKQLFSNNLALTQLWTWFVGMAIMTTPWHVLGLLGQPRRISAVQYNSLLTLAWEPYQLLMIIGGLILTGSAGLFVYILFKTQTEGAAASTAPEPTIAGAAPVSNWLNNFIPWNLVILGLMMLSYGWPILQFFVLKTYNPTAWGY